MCLVSPRAGRRFWCSLALVADRSGMAMQAQDRRDAGETLFTRALSGHGRLQTACAMPEGELDLSHRVCLGGLALLATALRASTSRIMKYCSVLLMTIGVRAEITDNANPKDELKHTNRVKTYRGLIVPIRLCKTVTSRKSSTNLPFPAMQQGSAQIYSTYYLYLNPRFLHN